MKKEGKVDKIEDFTKLTHKKGISLIVLIVTIIVIIILAAVVILTIAKNNPVSSAKEATFKEDVTAIQDELSMYLSKKYTDDSTSFDKSSVNLSGNSMVTELPSTRKYKDKVSVIDGNLVINDSKVNSDEKKWFNEVIGKTSNVKEEWQDTIASVKEGVPIPKGFKYKEGTKDTGLVIEDEKGNEFVWVPTTEGTYAKDTSFPSYNNIKPTGDDTLPNGIIDETADVVKYGGFYIGRYEAGIPEGDTSSSNKEGIPVSKKGATVWTNISYINAKNSAEKMTEDSAYVKTGLISGCGWDTMCHWLESFKIDIINSATYGNYKDSESPANITGYGKKQVTGFDDKWKVKNIYDLAGNVWEWTAEKSDTNFVYRGGSYFGNGAQLSISFRVSNPVNTMYDRVGFRVRLYIK